MPLPSHFHVKGLINDGMYPEWSMRWYRTRLMRTQVKVNETSFASIVDSYSLLAFMRFLMNFMAFIMANESLSSMKCSSWMVSIANTSISTGSYLKVIRYNRILNSNRVIAHLTAITIYHE